MTRVLAAVAAVALLCAASAALAEAAWIKGAPLNLRAGPGTQFRILATTLPGERVEVVERTEKWTKVTKPDGTVGWIAAGYLDVQAPPLQRVGLLEAEVEKLTGELDRTSASSESLETEAAALREREETRKAELTRLRQENLEFRAGARWPEWITGALILATGMALGAIIRQISSSRRQGRLRF